MIVYKVRHKPSGLFYQPVKGSRSHYKSNLSTKGKIYETKQYPKPKSLSCNRGVQVSDKLVETYNLRAEEAFRNKHLQSEESDWEIVTFKCEEI